MSSWFWWTLVTLEMKVKTQYVSSFFSGTVRNVGIVTSSIWRQFFFGPPLLFCVVKNHGEGRRDHRERVEFLLPKLTFHTIRSPSLIEIYFRWPWRVKNWPNLGPLSVFGIYLISVTITLSTKAALYRISESTTLRTAL